MFGGVGAAGASGEIDLGGPKQRAVLALLLVEPQIVVSVDRIIDTIWGDAAPARAEVSVRGYVSNLRKALAGAPIEFRDRGYVLDVPPESIDLHRFEQTVDQGRELLRAGQLPEARERLAQAVGLSAERPFGALADELHLDQVIAAIDQRRAEAAELLAEARLALGEHDTIGPDLTALIAAYPYRETLRVQHATAPVPLRRPGRRAPLDRGCPPHPRRRHRPRPRTGAPGARGGDPRPRPRTRLGAAVRSTVGRAAERGPPPARAASRSGVLRSGPGARARDRPAARLPAGGAVVVSGEAGIGKTALLRHLVDRAGDEGVIVGWGRCPESASDAPYRSWTMAARQAAANGGPPELVSLLARADAELADDPTAARLVTHLAVVDALQASPEPVLLVIDDLQWADDATLAMVEFLATELAYLPLVLALSVRRSGSTDVRPAVRDCLAELARADGAVQIALDGLGADSIRDWLSRSLDREPPADLIEFLTATTDGNPFYVRELLALLHTEGRLGLDASAARSASVPIAVQDVIRRRTSRQPPETQVLMASAAVIGRRFDLDVLAAVVDLDAARVLELLGPALDAGLVEVDDAVAGRYGFSHALVAETLVAEQNPSRLAQLHAQITIVLERLRAGRLDGALEELAHHACEGAPAGTARQAFRYSLAAADASHEARASGDEAEHLRRALAVQPAAEPGGAAQRVELLIRMGLALRDTGDVLAGRNALVDAALAAEELGDHDSVAAALAGLSPTDLWAAIDWSLSDPRAVALIERVLAREPAEATAAGVALTADLSAEIVYVEPERAAVLSGQAVAEAEVHGDPELLQRVLLIRYWAISAPGAWEERAAIGSRLVDLAALGCAPGQLHAARAPGRRLRLLPARRRSPRSTPRSRRPAPPVTRAAHRSRGCTCCGPRRRS